MAVMETALADASVADPESDFVSLFREYKLRAFHFAFQTLGNREDAMDITQEAFLRLHRHWRRRDKARPFAPWLYSIVRNLSIDLLRKRATRKECALDAATLEHSTFPNPEAEAGRTELSEQLWNEIRRLPPLQRETLLLRDWHGLSYHDIAQATGANITTVNSRLHDARVRLRQRLRRHL